MLLGRLTPLQGQTSPADTWIIFMVGNIMVSNVPEIVLMNNVGEFLLFSTQVVPLPPTACLWV